MKNQILCVGLFVLLAQAVWADVSPTDDLGLNLPTDSVNMCLNNPGALSYWAITFSGISGTYDIENQGYPGWCAEATVEINQSQCYPTMLHSSYDTAVTGSAGVTWEKITYMVNKNRNNGFTCTPTKYEIQALIWQYLGQTYARQDSWYFASDTACMTTVKNDVNLNGPGFVPSNGQIATVLADSDGPNGVHRQLIFVEIPYYIAPEVVSALAAMALASPAFAYLLIRKKK